MSPPAANPSMARLLRAHPLLFAALAVCVVLGAALAAAFMTDEWSLGRRIAAGSLAGFGSWFVVAANRLLGAWKTP